MGREGINFQADPDTRSVTREVPQLFCGILPARRSVAKACPLRHTAKQTAVKKAWRTSATRKADSEKFRPLFFHDPDMNLQRQVLANNMT